MCYPLMYMTLIERNLEEVNSNCSLRDWKRKILENITRNLMFPSELPTKESVIHYVADMSFDYHNVAHSGKLYADNHNPTDGDIDLLVKIVLAIFMECSLISPYDNYCQEVAWTKNQLLEKIKKDVRWQFDNES